MPGIIIIHEAGSRPVVGEWVVFSDATEPTYPQPVLHVGQVVKVDSELAYIYNDITDEWSGLDWLTTESVVVESPSTTTAV